MRLVLVLRTSLCRQETPFYYHSIAVGNAVPVKKGRRGGCPYMTEASFVNTSRSGEKCRAKTPISLPDGTPVHGQFFRQSSMSKLAIVAEGSAVKKDAQPEDLQFLAPLSYGYLTGGGTVLNVLTRQTYKVAVLGMGPVGLAALPAARTVVVETLVVVDIFDAKLWRVGRNGEAGLHAAVVGCISGFVDSVAVMCNAGNKKLYPYCMTSEYCANYHRCCI